MGTRGDYPEDAAGAACITGCGKALYNMVYFFTMDTARLDIRIAPDTKELIQKAAEMRKQSLTQFAVSVLSDAAEEVLAEHTRTVLSNRDRDLFLKLLDSPPEPNAALKQAAVMYRKRTSG